METIQIKAPQNPDDDSFTWTRCIETPSPTAKSAFFYVQEAGMLKMSAEQVSERQNMHSYLIVCVLSGEGYFTFRGKRTHASAGACFFIDCMEPYSHESSRDFPWQLIWVHFNGATSKQYYQYFTKNFPNLFFSYIGFRLAANFPCLRNSIKRFIMDRWLMYMKKAALLHEQRSLLKTVTLVVS